MRTTDGSLAESDFTKGTNLRKGIPKMRKPLLKPYLLAIFCVGVATLLAFLVHPVVPEVSFILFLGAVIVAGVYGGMGAALLTTLLSVVLTDYFFDHATFRFDFDLHDIQRAIVFTLVSVIVSQLASTRKRIIARLLSKTAELQTIFDHIPVMIGFFGEDGRLKLANREWERTLGWSQEEILAQDLDIIAECYPDREYRKYVRDFIGAANAEGGIFKTRIRDGRAIDTYWVNLSLPDGTSIGIGKDITEHKQTEEKLREYEKVVEGLEEMIVVVDEDYRYLIANRAYLKYRDLKSEQVVGHLITEIVGEEFFETVIRKNLEKCFRGEIVKYETTSPYPQLGERNLFISYLPIEGPHGVDRVACILRDITEAKKAEAALREAERKYRDIFENANEGIFQSTPEGQYIAANPALARMHGFDSAEELIRDRRDISGQIYVDPELRVEFKRLLEEQGTVRGFEHQVFRKDGSRIWISVNARAVCDEQGKIKYYEGTSQDINERKRAEEVMSKLAAIVEFSDDAIIGKTLEGTITSWNKGAEVMYGYLADEVVGRRISILIPPDRSDELRAILEKIGREQALEHYETERVRKDGQIINVSLTVSPIKNADGIVIGASTIARNITAHKRAAQVEKELHQRISDILENIGEGFVAIDREWRYTYVNRHAGEMLERRPEELVGKHVWTEFPNAVGSAGYHAHQLVMNERRSLEVEDHYAPLDRWFRNIVYPTPDGLAICFRDVTDQKRAEAALRESEKRFRLIAETITEVFWMADINIQTMIYVSPAYERVWGRSRESLYKFPRSFLDAIHADDRAGVLADLELKEDGEPFDHEYRIIRPDGVVRWIWDRGFPIRNESEKVTHFVGIAQDVTESKQAEAALRESEERYRDLVENSREYICTHDLDGLILSANRAACEVLGYDPGDFQGKKNFRDILVPEVRGQFDDYLARIRQDGIASGLVLVQTNSGERRMLEYHNTLRTEGVVTPIVRGMARDITEERSALKALHESEERFSKAFYSSPAPLIITRLIDGCFLNVNDSFLRTFGYARDEVIGKTVADLNIYVGQQDRKQLVDKLREHGALREYESRARTKSGRILDLLVFVEPVKLKGEQCILSTAYDITERKGMEEALRESEERYRELFENAKDALYVHDLSGRYTSFNRAAEQLSGFSRNEIIGKHFSNFVAPASLRSVRENLCKKLDDEGETTYEIDLITKDRRRVPVEVSSRLIYENGEPVGVQGVARDITERKRADEARARLALIVESSDDAIIGKTLEGTIVSWNSGAERIYGYSAREVIGCHISILVPPGRIDEVPRHTELIRRGESISHFETQGRKKDGQLINVSLTISPIRDARNQIVGGSTIARDITKRKQAEQALQTFSRRLIEAQEAERQHAARELHDEIGQVLTAVRLNLQSLQGLTPPGIKPPQIDESLGIVDEALDRVRELSLNLRPPVLDNLGLSSALRWYVDRYARSSGLVAELRNDLEEGQRLHLDLETACFRIVQEALTNVARHAHATHVLVRLTRSNGNLNLKIRDDGVGFDAETLLKTSPPASALGLRGMEERADAVRGQLKISSAAMRGTEISVSFPLTEEG